MASYFLRIKKYFKGIGEMMRAVSVSPAGVALM